MSLWMNALMDMWKYALHTPEKTLQNFCLFLCTWDQSQSFIFFRDLTFCNWWTRLVKYDAAGDLLYSNLHILRIYPYRAQSLKQYEFWQQSIYSVFSQTLFETHWYFEYIPKCYGLDAIRKQMFPWRSLLRIPMQWFSFQFLTVSALGNVSSKPCSIYFNELPYPGLSTSTHLLLWGLMTSLQVTCRCYFMANIILFRAFVKLWWMHKQVFCFHLTF